MIKHYVGARYVPKFASPLEWAADTSYEALTIVTFNNASYTSKVPVPPTVGDPADNPDYWALTGNYNAQVDQYRQETETVSNNLTTEITNRKNADNTLQAEFDELSENKADIIVSSASGSIASFRDGAESTAKKLVVGIEPVQDLHGYDHPWPAGGGVNQFAIADAVGVDSLTGATYGLTITLDNTAETIRIHGTPNWSDTNTGVTFRCISTAKGGYYGDAPVTHDYSGMAYKIFPISLSSNVSGITSLGISRGVITVTLAKTGNAEIDVLFKIVFATAGTTIGDWTPYSNICPITGWTGAKVTVSPTTDEADGQTYDITFPTEAGTVYGGTLDVTKGELVVDRVEVADLGTLSWSYGTKSNPPRFHTSLPYSGKNDPWWVKDVMISTGEYTLGENIGQDGADKKYGISSKKIYFTNAEYTNADDFKASITGTQVVYRIATPIHYPITAIDIKTLLGQNNIWADTGDTSVTYRADTKLYIDKKFTELQALILEN